MKTTKRASSQTSVRSLRQSSLAFVGGFLSAMLAWPASAGIEIPDDPLTTGARVAPNILFILDDSGSMTFEYMPDNVPSTSTPDVSDAAYTRNTLSYNPAVTYRPWLRADGNRMTGGTTYSAVYGSFNLVGGNTINLGSSSSCRRYSRNDSATTDDYGTSGWNGTQVCGGPQFFYVPKDTTQASETYLGNGRNYYRYEIKEGGSAIVRSEYGTITSTAVFIDGNNPDTGNLTSGGEVGKQTSPVPVGQTLRITIRNSSSSCGIFCTQAVLAYRVVGPSGNQVCGGSLTRGGSTTCSVSETPAGQYSIFVSRANSTTTSYELSATSSNSCGSGSGSGWINCQPALPSDRTLAQELSNYATWFSYHRTRMKAAKAGASEAFGTLDGQVRVGYRTIWNRNGFNIPVNDGNDGRFVDNEDDPTTPVNEATTSRSTWYDRLHAAMGYNGTPLLSALTGAGEYFSSNLATGPYGPQAGERQLSCRQNFAILTTDGYWNSESVSIGNVDATDGTEIVGPNNQRFTYEAEPPYRDDYSNTLADVAMYYWKRDLRPEAHMTNNVPSTTANPAFWQHMVTFGISIGMKTSMGWSSVSEVPANPNWPNPRVDDTSGSASYPSRIDDLLHAAVNGRGEFVSASNPSEFADGLRTALAAIAERTSSSSNVAANSVSLDTDSKVFNASYVSGIWSGNLTAREIVDGGLGDISWHASIPHWSVRKVFTSNGTAGREFPTASQVTALARGGGPSNFQVTGEDNANYLMGEQRLEQSQSGTLRSRTSLLGDIINSSPAYVADTDTLYVGANDGMLHAFSAATGVELFAFVPSMIDFNALSTLSRPDYAHHYFVDGPVVVSSRMQTPNKNILVGTLGRGGKGMYALDVTSPAGFGVNNFKWELAETPGENMGLMLGKPLLANVASASDIAVVAGNGVNSARDEATLLVINAETGSVIREIETGAGSAAQPNGLFAPTGVLGSDGRTLAYVYAGDMLGNVWKFDLRSANPSAWSATRIFTAVDADGRRQPITAGIAVAVNPLTNKRWVFFGTGRFLTTDDASSTYTDVHSMYGFVDDGVAVAKGDLTQRTIAVQAGQVNGRDVRAFEARTPLPAGSKGWYIDLPERGERIVQDAQIVSTFLVTASMIPSGNACDGDGTGYINALDAFTGTSAGGSYFDLDGDGSTSDETVSNLPIGSINLGVGMPTLPNLLRSLLVVGGSGGGGLGGTPTLSPRWDRASWREIRRD